MERLRSIELRMSEIRAKASSLGGASAGAQFRDVLESETLGQAVGNRALSTSSTYGALQPRADLASWGNGRIPPSLLESIGQGDHRSGARRRVGVQSRWPPTPGATACS